jgi:electron transport complex protein RnfC
VLTGRSAARQETHPCIRCGRCLDACPVFLNPADLAALAQAARYDEMEPMHLADCMLCGSCSYVCPSSIPLSQMFALSKMTLKKRSAQAAQAEKVIEKTPERVA